MVLNKIKYRRSCVFFFTHDINSIIENSVYLSGLNLSPQLTLIKMLI